MNELAWSRPEYAAIVQWLGERAGLMFRPDQRETVEDGVRRVMKRVGVDDLQEFAEKLRRDPPTFSELIIELTVGETFFFREPKQLEHLRRELIPELLRRRGPGHTLRIWCAGCASGEEAYSLAVLCEQEGWGETSRILATDISAASLARAKQARYREWSLRGEGAQRMRRYLTKRDDGYHLEPRIAKRVQFETLNLATAAYPSYANGTKGLDLIFCRNVLIYFDPQTIADTARRFYDALADDGWLITASGDPPLGQHAAFETALTDGGVFYRKPPPQFASQEPPARTTPKTPTSPPPVFSSPAVSSTVASQADSLVEAEAAFARGDYRQASDLAAAHLSDLAACVLHLKALSNLDPKQAAEQAAELTQWHPLAAELQFLRASLLLQLNRAQEAEQAATQAVFLDRSLAAGHFLLGAIQQQRGALPAAYRHFRNARNLCTALPPEQPLALADRETAGQMAVVAQAKLSELEAAMEKDA